MIVWRVRLIKDIKFLNALWQYVLFGRDSWLRIMPICRIGFCNLDFTFQGLGGMKRIELGWIYIPVDNDKLYVIPDIVFHYFYVNRIAPSKKFRNAVIYGAKPKSEEYIAKHHFTTFFNSTTTGFQPVVVELLYVEGYSTAEIARMSNRTRQAVNQLKHRTLD